MNDGKLIGQGFSVIKVDAPSSGVVRYLKTPQDVLRLVKEGNVSETVVMARAGTVTFVGPVLPRKPAGIITIEGMPQSHLGILAREFGVPAVMSIQLADSTVERLSPSGVTREEYVNHVAETLDGRHVVVDCSDPETGRLFAAD
jgi:signal transduction protein with GAF and PtsI domain